MASDLTSFSDRARQTQLLLSLSIHRLETARSRRSWSAKLIHPHSESTRLGPTMSASARRHRSSTPSRAYKAGQKRAEARDTEAEDAPLIERILAFSSLGLIALAVVSYLATLFTAMFTSREVLTEDVWPVVVWISYVGLPLGFILLIVLIIINMRRRSKAQQTGRKRS